MENVLERDPLDWRPVIVLVCDMAGFRCIDIPLPSLQEQSKLVEPDRKIKSHNDTHIRTEPREEAFQIGFFGMGIYCLQGRARSTVVDTLVRISHRMCEVAITPVIPNPHHLSNKWRKYINIWRFCLLWNYDILWHTNIYTRSPSILNYQITLCSPSIFTTIRLDHALPAQPSRILSSLVC